MKTLSKLCQLLVISSVIAVVGCSEKPPETMTAGGTVTLNGDPLVHAEVRFFPQAEGLDMNFSSVGLTDANGKFTLKLVGQQVDGVCICKHQVTVTEGPLPDEARSNSDAAQTVAVQFMQSLKNRPIPDIYANLVTSPIQIEVVPGQADYKIELLRKN